MWCVLEEILESLEEPHDTFSERLRSHKVFNYSHLESRRVVFPALVGRELGHGEKVIVLRHLGACVAAQALVTANRKKKFQRKETTRAAMCFRWKDSSNVAHPLSKCQAAQVQDLLREELKALDTQKKRDARVSMTTIFLVLSELTERNSRLLLLANGADRGLLLKSLT